MTQACFTADMAETLVRFFHAYAREGVVTLELTERGLWLVHPHDRSRQFLGQAVPNERERRLLERARQGMN